MIKLLPVLQRAARPSLIAVALLAFASAAHAQHKPSPAAMATANELIQVTGATKLFKPLIPGVVEQAKTPFLQQDPTVSGDLDQIAAKINTDLEPRFSEITKQVATLYATHFSEQELKAILAFYKSPVGQKLLAQQPAIIESSMRFAQGWANKLTDEVIQRMRADLKKRGHKM